MTGSEAGALTVAGQWRSFTAFPSILAIAVVSCAAALSGCNDVTKLLSMTSTFIAGETFKVKKRGGFQNHFGIFISTYFACSYPSKMTMNSIVDCD